MTLSELELAKELNKQYQEINNSVDWKTGKKEVVDWDKLPKTTQFVWIKMAVVTKPIFIRQWLVQ